MPAPAQLSTPTRHPSSPRKPPTTPIEFNFRTSTRHLDRAKTLAWRRSLKGWTFKFFDLPAEIRNRVYECLCADRLVKINCSAAWPGPHKGCTGITRSENHQPSLSRTCRQAREELLPFFYARNMFQLRCRWQYLFYRKWIDAIALHHRYLRRVRVVGQWSGELSYNILVSYNDRKPVLTEALKVRTSMGLVTPKAIALARRVEEVLEECRLASSAGRVADEEVGGYAILQVVKALTEPPDSIMRWHGYIVRSFVLERHGHQKIYPELRTIESRPLALESLGQTVR